MIAQASHPDHIPQANPRATFIEREVEIRAACGRVLESGRYILGPEVQAFESEFAAFIGVDQAIGMANGTQALELALRASGVERGDAVITVSHTAVATVAAVEALGAVPLLVDIDPDRLTMDPNRLEKTLALAMQSKELRRQLKAVVPVHLYGQMADMPAITELADRHGIKVVEDCAQAHGSALQGRASGSWGVSAAFSFYPTKNLAAMGDGGMVVTRDPGTAERARLLREYGWRERYVSEIVGTNSRLDELQAAILRVNLSHLSCDNRRRGLVADQYDRDLEGVVDTPPRIDGTLHAFHQYVVRTRNRHGFRSHLQAHGIMTAVHYPAPVHLQPAYRRRLIGSMDLPVTEAVARQVVSLPMFPQLEAEEIGQVTEAIGSWSPPVSAGTLPARSGFRRGDLFKRSGVRARHDPRQEISF